MGSRYLPQLNYIFNFVYDRDVIPRYPIAIKFRWTVKNMMEYGAEVLDVSLVKLLHLAAGHKAAKAIVVQVPDIVVGYLPLGQTFLFGPTINAQIGKSENTVILAKDNTWFTTEYDKSNKTRFTWFEKGFDNTKVKNLKQVDDDGWMVGDHTIGAGYARLFKERARFESLAANLK